MSEPKTREQALEYVLTQAGIEKKDQGAWKTLGSLNRLAMTPDDILESMAPSKMDLTIVLQVKKWIQEYLVRHDGNLPTSWLKEFTESIFVKYMMVNLKCAARISVLI